jgi:ParB-like chromosome segregation protein Spo0J
VKTKEFDKDGIFHIPRNTIHPDPDQPRVKVDDDLQASIDSEGIIQAITVRPHPEFARRRVDDRRRRATLHGRRASEDDPLPNPARP